MTHFPISCLDMYHFTSAGAKRIFGHSVNIETVELANKLLYHTKFRSYFEKLIYPSAWNCQ